MNPEYTIANTDHPKNVILSAAAPANMAVPIAAPAALNTIQIFYLIITEICIIISILISFPFTSS